MNKDMSTALFCDCETDADRAEFFASGRAVETGVIAPSIAAEVAQAFAAHAQLAEKERECERLREVLAMAGKGLGHAECQNWYQAGCDDCDVCDAQIAVRRALENDDG